MKQLLLGLCIFFVITTIMSAQAKFWDGGGVLNNWKDPANWNLDILPVPGDSVIISGATVVLDNTAPTIKSLLLLSSAELTIGPNVTITFTGSLSYAIRLESSHVENNGKIAILDVGDYDTYDRAIELIGSTFQNNNICNIVEAKAKGIFTGGNFVNEGEITIKALFGSAIEVWGNFTNIGNISITDNGNGATGIYAAFFGEFVNTGMIDIEVSSRSGLLLQESGLLINTGNIDINATSGAVGIRLDASGFDTPCNLELDAGIIDIQLTNSNGILLRYTSTLTIESGAEIKVSGMPQDYLMDVDLEAILDCNGVLDLNN